MSITKALEALSSKHVTIIVALSALLSSWSMILSLTPGVELFLEKIESSYDSTIPEISIKNGKASIKERQPHYITSSYDKDVTLVIDTREKKQREAYELIRETPYGIAITKDFMVFKNHDQLSEISFRDLPDMVINSTTLLSALREYSPKIWFIAWTVFICYFLVAKTAQICLFSLIPMIITKRLSCPIPYAVAVRFTAISMIIPVVIDFFLNWLSLLGSVEPFIYFGVFAVVLFRITRDHIRSCSEEFSPVNQI